VGAKQLSRRIAAIGASLAAIALLLGASQAAADELSDLRGNSELLRQRLDEIQRVQAGAGATDSSSQANGAARPAVSAGSFPRSFLIPGTDTSVSIGGSAGETVRYGIAAR
jgi:hypothetical protein